MRHRLERAALAALLPGLGIAGAWTIPLEGQRAPLPPIPNIAGKVLTVKGPVDPGVLGETLMHEHIFIDFQSPQPRPQGPAAGPVTLANLGAVRMGLGSPTSNGFLADFDESLHEVMEFKYAGGGTIVDMSNIGLGRDPKGLARISNASGLHVVMGAGWYQKQFHPLDMDQKTVEEMTDAIVRDIVVGVDATAIRSGVIGEVGINGNPLTENERKSTRASGRASRLTGAPISFHVGGVGEEKFEVLDILASEGVDMSHVVMGHSNALAVDLPLARRVLARGVSIEFDYLGAPGSPGGYLSARDDKKVAKGLVALVKEGYADRIVLGHDVCTKIQLKAYGGLGFTYISDYFLPELREMGVSEQDIHKMMVENPRRVLAFTAPRTSSNRLPRPPS